MGTYLMKCSPDRDLYVEWSSVVDNMTWMGTRAEALRLPQTDEARLKRTDETGTSTLWKVAGYPVEGAWDDPTIHVCNTQRRDEHVYSYSLRRVHLAAYAVALAAGDTAEAESYLSPNRHCLSVRLRHRRGPEDEPVREARGVISAGGECGRLERIGRLEPAPKPRK